MFCENSILESGLHLPDLHLPAGATGRPAGEARSTRGEHPRGPCAPQKSLSWCSLTSNNHVETFWGRFGHFSKNRFLGRKCRLRLGPKSCPWGARVGGGLGMRPRSDIVGPRSIEKKIGEVREWCRLTQNFAGFPSGIVSGAVDFLRILLTRRGTRPQKLQGGRRFHCATAVSPFGNFIINYLKY